MRAFARELKRPTYRSGSRLVVYARITPAPTKEHRIRAMDGHIFAAQIKSMRGGHQRKLVTVTDDSLCVSGSQLHSKSTKPPDHKVSAQNRLFKSGAQ